jgi:hypothetical protein
LKISYIINKKKNKTKEIINIFIKIDLVFFITFSSPLDINMLYPAKRSHKTKTIPSVHHNTFATSKISALALDAKLTDCAI